MSDYTSAASGESTRLVTPQNLRVNSVTYVVSFRVDSAGCSLKPDWHDEMLLAIFRRDVARATKEAWTVAAMLNDHTESWKEDRTM